MLRVTVDTNVLSADLARMRRAAQGTDVQIAPTTVTLRENEDYVVVGDEVVAESGVYDESKYDSGAVYADHTHVVYETAVIGEWRLGMAVLGGDDAPSMFDAILAIIGDGSFPPVGKREDLTRGERRQLRDAMILEAHTRDRRDVLVSDDVKAFGGEKRVKLEALCDTRIRTVDEFCSELPSLT